MWDWRQCGLKLPALVEFAVLRDKGQAKNKVRTLNFRKADFQLFKGLVGPHGKLPSGTR